MVSARRPPKIIALMGTPSGLLTSGASIGLLIMGAAKRLFGCATLSFESGVQRFPRQSRQSAGGGPSLPSHQTSLSGVRPTFVKMVSRAMEAIAFGLDLEFVPGTTPKYPDSGLIAYRRPPAPGFIQAISSPTVHTFHPLKCAGGTSMAKLVLPHALGKAAATKVFSPVGDSTPRMSMCSASQPSLRPRYDPMRSARHFFPKRTLPP